MLSTKTFTGEFPRVLPYLAPPNAAQYALDCDFSAGSLRGVRGNGATGVSGSAKSIYVHGDGDIYYWSSDVRAFRGPVANDAFDRFYWLDDTGVLRVSQATGSGGTPSTGYKAGVPFPSSGVEVDDVFPLDGVSLFTNVYVESSTGDIVKELTPTSVTFDLSTRLKWQFTLSGFSSPLSAELKSSSIVTKTAEVPIDPDDPLAGTTTETYSDAVEQDIGTLAVKITAPDGQSWILRGDQFKSTINPSYKGSITNTDTTIVGTIELDTSSAYVENRAYVTTYVNEWGEEGAPSDPINVEASISHVIDLVIPAAQQDANYCPIEKIRVYRSVGGGYLFVTEMDASGGDFRDGVPPSQVSEPLSTDSYYPPDDGLTDLVALPNGIFAVSKNNEIYFSEPYLPYAWKPENAMTTLDPVVGMCAAEGGVYVTTKSNPYFVSGMTPDAMSQTKITSVQAGVAKRAICNLGFAVAYASNDGICMARGVDVTMDWSFKFFTREDWRDRYGAKLSNMRLDAHDGNLLVWFDDGTPGFLVRFDGEDPSMTQLSDGYYASFVYPQGDALYLSTGSAIVEFKGSAVRSDFVWHSKDFISNKPINYGAIQLVGTGVVTVDCYAEGSLYYTKSGVSLTDTGITVFRLPSGKLARRWSFKITGGATAEVYEYNVAVSVREFQNV